MRNLKLNRSEAPDLNLTQQQAATFSQHHTAPQPQEQIQKPPAPVQQTDFRISEDEFDKDTFSPAKRIEDYSHPLAPDDPGRVPGNLVPEIDDPQPGFGGGSIDDMGGGTGVSGMTEDAALEETRKLMDMRESGQSLLISLVADGTAAGYEKYNYKPWQKELLVKAWAPIIQARNIKVPPYMQILYAEGMSTAPLVVLMVKNRKARLENEDLRRQLLEANMKLAKAANGGGLQTMQDTPGNDMVPPKNVQIRKDIKTLWQVDDNGKFKYSCTEKDPKTHNYRYLPEAERKDKPMLTPDNYDRLCKHNGKSKIDLIFKLGVDNAG